MGYRGREAGVVAQEITTNHTADAKSPNVHWAAENGRAGEALGGGDLGWPAGFLLGLVCGIGIPILGWPSPRSFRRRSVPISTLRLLLNLGGPAPLSLRRSRRSSSRLVAVILLVVVRLCLLPFARSLVLAAFGAAATTLLRDSVGLLCLSGFGSMWLISGRTRLGRVVYGCRGRGHVRAMSRGRTRAERRRRGSWEKTSGGLRVLARFME